MNCGGGFTTRFFDKQGEIIYWVDNNLRELYGVLGYRTLDAWFKDWNSIHHIKCACCGYTTMANSNAGCKIIKRILETSKFGYALL